MHALTYFLVPQLVLGAVLGPRQQDKRAAYFLDNNPAGASIVSLTISPEDGTLSNPIRTSTGGVGLYGLSASSTGGPPTAAGADTFFTQDSVVVSENYLFTVNAGSHTLSMFFIDKYNPSKPCLIGRPIDTLGEFPVAVAYASHIKTACVINGGAVAGVSCYSTDHVKGLKPLGGLRPIALNQTTPPIGPPGTVSDLVFNPSFTALIAVIKGNGKDPGFIYAYPVKHDGSISTTPIISRPAELLVDFSISFLGDDSRAIITDPAYGASIVHISEDFKFSVATKIPIAGEAAVCWSVYSQRFNTIYVFDVGVPNITLIDPWTGAIKGTIAQPASDAGSVDAAIDREYLYSLKSAPFINVIKNDGLNHGVIPKQIQSFDLSSLGSRQGFVGMAIYPS